MKYKITFFIFAFLFSTLTLAQNPNVKWKKTEVEIPNETHPFHSTQAINLPTTETLQKGNFEFEISHRFIPTIKSGSKDLYGFDGPVNMRIALGYGITDNTFAALGRSNLNDNIDLWVKQKVLNLDDILIPSSFALRFGAAYNIQAYDVKGKKAKEMQYYFQLIFNSSLTKYFAVGIVPSYLYNSYIFVDEKKYSFTLGTNFQYYISSLISVMLEWNPTITGVRLRTNPVGFGIELETGGHFFKVILTNSTELNPSQFLAGTRSSFNNGEWHIGFNITRLLKL